MKKPLLYVTLIALLIIPARQGSAERRTPSEIAGFKLGDKIEKYTELVRMETALPLRDSKYLTQVLVRELEGYKSGTIEFGNCAEPGRILRIKLKYAYSDRKFYDELLARFKKRLGKPDEWRGDPFHVIIAWKWSFRDKDHRRISLILQHSRDDEYKWGNSVKLTNRTLLNQERSCYESKHAMGTDPSGDEIEGKVDLKKIDFTRLVPN